MALAAVGLVAVGAAAGAVATHWLGGAGPKRQQPKPDADGDAAAANGTAPAADAGPPVRAPPPHPGWRPGDPQPPPYGPGVPFVTLDVSALDKPSLYALVISAVVPRPIAFVSSLSAAGGRNLSPYSYFNVMSHNPFVLAIGACRSPARGGGKKDTLLNIEETGEFVVNLISEWFVEAANHTCGEYPRGVDELELSGLTPTPSTRVAPPRVAEAAVAFECRLRAVHELTDAEGKSTSAIILGDVLTVHIAEPAASRSPSGKVVVDAAALRPVSRLGGITYGRLGALYDIPRPDGTGRYP